MRVAVVLPGLAPTIGGGFTFVEEVARALEECTPPAGMELVLLSETDSTGKLPRAKVRTEGTLGRARRRFARTSQRLERAVGAASPVEIAAREAGASIVWFPAGNGEAIDLPFVMTVWDVQHRTHPWFPEVSELGLWRSREDESRERLSRAMVIVCGTAAGAEELERFYQVPRNRIILAPHPTPGWALAEGRADRSAVPDGPYFLYPAQFWAHKNHALLIRALAIRHREGSRASLVLIGRDFGVRPQLTQLAADLGLSKFVHFPGFVSRDALRSLYQEALALVYPAFSGPENLPPLEAFALGCPVANADFPGAREQLGDGAIYFDPTDPHSIASSMARVESDAPLRSQLIDTGRRIAASRRGDAFVSTVLAAIARCRAWVDPFSNSFDDAHPH